MSFIETIGGVDVKDPFRWLEDDTDPQVIEWQRQANASTVAQLAASPHLAAVAESVRSTFEDPMACWAPKHFGDFWFRMVLPAGSSQTAVEVSGSATGPARMLLDPRDYGAEARLAMYTPSADGKAVLIQMSVGAAVRLLLLETASGAILRDLGQIAVPAAIAWTHDSSGFLSRVMGMKAAADGHVAPVAEIWWHPVAGEASREQIETDDPGAWAVTATDSHSVAILANQGAPRPIWLRRNDGDAWTPFLSAEDAMYKGIFVDDEFWAISDDTSGWCRLVAIPLDTFKDRSTWREIVAPREGTKLGAVTLCGSYIALATVEAGVMRLRSLDRSGREVGEVPLPGDGAFGLFGLGHILMLAGDVVVPDGNGCTFVHSSLERGCGVYRADLATLSIEELKAPVNILDARVSEYFEVEGPHGPVPYRIMRKASTPLDGSAPVIVTGYGGFNVPQLPAYSSFAAAWTELGGVWVHGHLRGGGERDTAFWRDGRMHRKQSSFDDLYALIEDLQARGFARPEHTGVFGTSNGGLLVGAAVTQRPELIRAALAQVPILDLMQSRKDPATYGAVMIDYGDPNDPKDAPVMHAYSPYHNVRAGAAYPALLCDSGADDLMTPPWHSRKMVAAVEQASASGRRTLLRVRQGAGHNQMNIDDFIERDTEELTFFCDELMTRKS